METSHRNTIGFKVTDNKVMVYASEEPIMNIDAFTPQDEAIFTIARKIHMMMEQRAGMMVHAEPFFDIEGDKIIPLLNKVYIKYYEKI